MNAPSITTTDQTQAVTRNFDLERGPQGRLQDRR